MNIPAHLPNHTPLKKQSQKLDAMQSLAVETTEGYVCVIAGAGSGKTSVITNRYLHLVRDLGISSSNVLCVTFTNKAANEMKRRIRHLALGEDTCYISTFHGFCVRFLREEIHTISYPKEFMILDEDDEKALIKKAYKELNLHLSDLKIKSAMDFISKRKSIALDYVELFAANKNADNSRLLHLIENENDKWMKVYYRYLYEQKKNFALDFDDLIYVTLYILENFKEKLDKWSRRMMYVMVDEFQDIDFAQYKLADLISSFHKNLFVVGDPDQTIYTWRGADVKRILEFAKVHENTTTIFLENNYRSSASILKILDSIIKNNKLRMNKALHPVRLGGKTPVFFHGKDLKDESMWIVSRIEDALAQGVLAKDIAVLYRMHSQSRSVEEALTASNIPYKVYSGIGFYQRAEVKDAISYLRMLIYADDMSFLRVVNTPKRMFGQKKIALLEEFASKCNLTLYEALQEIVLMATTDHALCASKGVNSILNFDAKAFISKTKITEFVSLIEKYKMRYKDMHVSDVLSQILHESGYEEMLRLDGDENRLCNLAELKQGIMEFEKYFEEDATLDEYLQNIALFTETDTLESNENAIQLMTIHNAKGLEFSNVFVCGLNEGCFPSKRIKNDIELEEERRLAYVAFTRAQNVLCLSDSVGSATNSQYPSRFLFEINFEDIEIIQGFSESFIEEAASYIEKLDFERHLLANSSLQNLKAKTSAQFSLQNRVHHAVFGFGTIVFIDESNFSYSVKFDTLSTPRSIRFDFPLNLVLDGKPE